jgi:hypothetical protein
LPVASHLQPRVPGRSTSPDSLTNLIDVARWCDQHGLPGHVVGRWVSIRFPEKPDADTHAALKAVGFRWVKRRGEWAHNCAHPSTRGTCDPRWKYGQENCSFRFLQALFSLFRRTENSIMSPLPRKAKLRQTAPPAAIQS